MLKRLIYASLAAASLISPALATEAPIRISLNSDIRSTHPSTNRDFNTDTVLLHIVEGLVAFNEKTLPVPMLAEKIDVSADGKLYTFKLRSGVTFHNGAPLTAGDVVWSLKHYLDPATQWYCRAEMTGRIANIIDVKAIDASTVAVSLEKAAPLFLVTLARPDCGETAILHPSSVDANGAWVRPVGTGPYKLGEWRQGQYIDLVPFANYASLPGEPDGFVGGKKALAPLRFMIVPDTSAAKTALLAGGIDVVTDVPSSELLSLRDDRSVRIVSAPTMGITCIVFNTRAPFLKDARIRRAIELSIDVPEIVDGLVGTDAPPNSSLIPSSSSYHDIVQSAVPQRDLPAARKLLAEAGYKGQPIKMMTNRRYADLYDASVAVQGMAAEAGINIQLEVLDWPSQLDSYNRGLYQSMAMIFSGRFDPSLTYDAYTGSRDVNPNRIWEDPDALKLVKQTMETSDRAARQSDFDKLYAMFIDQVPIVVLYNQPSYTIVRPNVTGLKAWASGYPRLWNVSKN